MLLLKNPQFLRNHNETWSKCSTLGLFIFTKFCNDCIKIVYFLIKAYFWGFLKFGVPYCSVLHFLFSVNKTRFVDIYLQFYISINLVESRPILNFRLRPLKLSAPPSPCLYKPDSNCNYIFTGVGIASAVVSLNVALYYNTVIAWCLYYFGKVLFSMI